MRSNYGGRDLASKFTQIISSYLEDTQERIRAIRLAQDGMAFPAESYSNSQLNNEAGSMLSVIVQSESGDNSSGASSVHLPMEKRDFTFTSHSPNRGRADGPSRTIPESRPSFHRNHTSQSNVTPPPPSPGGVAATNTGRNPKITIPQLVVRQPTNRSYLAPLSPGAEVATLNSRRIKNRRNSNASQLLARQWTNTSQGRDLVPPSPAVPPSSPASRVMRGFSHLMDPLRRHPYSELSLNALIPLLSQQELAFFSALDNELHKVESFYLDREKEMKARTRDLEAQLRELDEHRRLFDAAHPDTSFSWTAVLNPSRFFRQKALAPTPPRIERIESAPEPLKEDAIAIDDVSSGLKKERRAENGRWQERLNPKEYLNARRKLKKAVLEHYRGLEMLHNYRIPAQRAYMEEKVERSAFSSDETLRVMMDEMQKCLPPASGDTKKAMTRLRAGPQYKSHHNSTFCSGIAIGSALAALGSGIAHSFQQSTRDAIPGWSGLLFIFGVLALPVIFALLVGLNLLVWARARINYVFIFVSPTIWPLVWLAFAGIVLIDPFPILFKPSRYWLIKNVGKLLRSGTKRVKAFYRLLDGVLVLSAGIGAAISDTVEEINFAVLSSHFPT
ncbi:SPX domain-containing protein [Mycena rosella]|uniref:SPX domain-containing protein n=1 Tax=Mycena rosella TaxID=1033263 RepID=A0AAD7D7T0_MYCRO|nr:SPX domain-containing protein [Mycena rosella]